MGKQTMGVPLHALTHRSDNKLYRLQTAQSPLVRPYLHDDLDIDHYPLGTNAIVAVLSYTVWSFLSVFTPFQYKVPMPPGKSWIFAWKFQMLENHSGPGNSWKLKLKVLEKYSCIQMEKKQQYCSYFYFLVHCCVVWDWAEPQSHNAISGWDPNIDWGNSLAEVITLLLLCQQCYDGTISD